MRVGEYGYMVVVVVDRGGSLIRYADLGLRRHRHRQARIGVWIGSGF